MIKFLSPVKVQKLLQKTRFTEEVLEDSEGTGHNSRITIGDLENWKKKIQILQKKKNKPV